MGTDIHRMNQTMERLEKMTESEYSNFIRVLFGLSTPSPVSEDLGDDLEAGKIDWIDPTLNDSQKNAIRFALASKEVALIHGPPGVMFFKNSSIGSSANYRLDGENPHFDRVDSSDVEEEP